MTEKTYLTHNQLMSRAIIMRADIEHFLPQKTRPLIYPVPRGGVPVAYLLLLTCQYSEFHPTLTDDPNKADVFVDDIIDSGKTRDRYMRQYPNARLFTALVDKTREIDAKSGWIVFPWDNAEETGIEDNIVRILQNIGEDPNRQGLQETPKRVAKAWEFWSSGYSKKPEDILKTFEDGADGVDEMVLVKDIPFYTHCEHHLAPFFGTATIAYIPKGKIVGLSKLSRLVDMYARRLQVQERLTNQIADALDEHLQPLGVGVVIKARHLCMESRGVCQQGHHTITSAVRGALRSQPAARQEFLALSK